MAPNLYNVAPKFYTSIVLACTVMLTFWLYQDARQAAQTELLQKFETRVQEIHQKLLQNISSYEQVIRGAKGLFSASRSVDRHEFRLYADELSIQQRFRGMQGLGFSQLIPSAQLPVHIAAIQAKGFTDYTLRPSGKRNIYTSIIFIEPFKAENLRAFGYDMYADVIRRTAMNKSRDTGQSSITDKISLVQFSGEKESAGFIMYLPVYVNDLPHETLIDRQTNITGWVYAPIRMMAFMESLKSEAGSDLNISIGDIDGDGNIKPLFGISSNHQVTKTIHKITTLNILGRSWKVSVYPTQSFFKHLHDPRPNLILITGLCLSFLLSSLIWLLTNGRARALQLAETMTEDLRESEFRWKFALEGAGDGVWDWDYKTGKVQYSTRWKSMLGYADNEIENLFSEWERLVHPEDRELAISEINNFLKRKIDTYAHELRMLHKNGSWVWILTRGMIVSRTENGEPLRLIGTHCDISKQKSLEHSLFESENRFRLSFDNAPIGMALVDLDGKWLKVNKSLCILLGMTEVELLASTFQEITHPDDLSLDLENVNELLVGTIQDYQMEKRYIIKSGKIIWVNLSVSLVRDDHSNPVHFVSQIEDITERKLQEAEIVHLAYYDTLTNLPNRRVLQDRMSQAMLRAQRENKVMAVFFLDIDYFKKINDTFGHDYGDKVLKMTAEKLDSCIRKSDTLGRQSGDEFLIVLSEIKVREDVVIVAENIMKKFSSPFDVMGQQIKVTLSIGIAIYEKDSFDTLEAIIKRADIALYEAKGAGRNGYKINHNSITNLS